MRSISFSGQGRLPVRLSRRSLALITVATLATAAVALGGGHSDAAANPAEASSGPYWVAPLIDYPDVSTPLTLAAVDENGNSAPDDLTLRIASDRRSTLPADSSYSWLGPAGSTGWTTGDLYNEPGTVSFNPQLYAVSDSQLAAADTTQTLALDHIVGPGTFMWYEVGTANAGTTATAAPSAGGYRLGTGVQRDGTAQSPRLALPRSDGGFQDDMIARFGAEGLYCVTLSYTAHPADSASAVTARHTVRFAVGDTVPADAACGAAPPAGGPTPPVSSTPTTSTTPTPPPTPTTSPTSPPSDPNSGTGPTGNEIWTDGHVDAIYPTIDTAGGGAQTLQLRSHDDRTRNWNDVVYYSSDAVKHQLPEKYTDRSDYSFIGGPGQTVWNSPQTAIDGAPWIGLSTQDGSLAPLAGQPFQIRLDAVRGGSGQAAPGDVVIWDDSAAAGGGGSIYASTRTGLPAGWRVGRNTHAHFNWAFTRPGVYCLAFTVTAPMPDGRRQSASQQLTMAVGSSVDPKTVTPCGLTQPYPAPGTGKPVVTDPTTAPVLIDEDQTSFAPRLDGDRFTVGLRRADSGQAGVGRTTSIDDAIVHAPSGLTVPYRIDRQAARGLGPQLAWDTTGVPAGAVTGDINWKLEDVRGPGTVSITELEDSGTPLVDTARGRTGRALWPDGQAAYSQWDVSRPGKYCIGMTWTATLSSGRTVSDHHVLTLVVDGPLDPKDYRFNPNSNGTKYVSDGAVFRHDADTLTRTCNRGGRPTTPQEVPIPGGTSSPPSGPPGHPVNSGRDVLRIGHMDVMSTVTGNHLAVTVHDDNTSPATIHDPARSTFYAAAGSEAHIPAGADYAFLGAAGRPVWILPQTQDPSLLWPGWNVTLTGNTAATGVRWKLNSVTGPGDFALFQDVGFGGVQVLLDSDDPAHSAFTYHEHAHGSWAFSSAGVYCLNSTYSAVPAGIGAAQNVVLLVAVGDLNPAVVTPADCGRTAAQIRAAGGGSTGSSPPSHGGAPSGSALSASPAPAARPVTTANPCRPVTTNHTVAARPAATARVFAEGHFDFGPQLVGGVFASRLKTDTQGWLEPAEAVFAVDDTAKTTLPHDPAYSFIGPAGSTVWMIPQTQRAGIPWLGWNTQDRSIAGHTTGPVRWSLDSVDGPGRLAIYTDGTFGGVNQRILGSVAGGPSSYDVPVGGTGVHVHGNWAFTAAGVYHVHFTESATVDGKAYTDAAVLNFAIGDIDPQTAAPGGAGAHTVSVTSGVDAAGDPCALSGALAQTGENTGNPLIAGLGLVLAGALVLSGTTGLERRQRRNRVRTAS